MAKLLQRLTIHAEETTGGIMNILGGKDVQILSAG